MGHPIKGRLSVVHNVIRILAGKRLVPIWLKRMALRTEVDVESEVAQALLPRVVLRRRGQEMWNRIIMDLIIWI